MEFERVVKRRRMVRNYDPDRPVPPEVVDRLLGYAVRAPSAGFTQGWGFLVLDTAADLDVFWAATTPEKTTAWLARMRRAPLIVVPHSNRDAYRARYAEPDKDREDAPPYWDIDAGFASLLMLLGAVDEGLGACFFGIPAERVTHYRRAFGVPDDFRPIGAITVGYAEPDPRSPSLKRGRRPVSEVAHRGRWGGSY